MPTTKPRATRKLKVAKSGVADISPRQQPERELTLATPFVPPSPPLRPPPSLRCLLAAAAIIIFPLFTLPWALEAHELYKMILLGAAVAVGLGFVLSDALRKGEFTLIPRHAFVVLGLLTLVLATVSAWRSGLGVTAFVGYGGTEALSVLGLLLLGLWVLLAYHGGRESFGLMYKSLAISGTVLALITIAALAGLKLYWFIPAAGFNPAGTTTVAGIIAAVSVILWLGKLQTMRTPSWLAIVGGLLPLVLLFGIDFRAPWIVLAVGTSALLLLGLLKRLETSKFALASLLIVLLLAILGATTNLIPSFLTTPLEVAPSHKETWSVATQTLSASPLLGSGPASFAKEYLRFRSLPILQTPFWNVAFDWGSSAALTFLGNLGWVGGALLLLTILSIIIWYGKNGNAALLAAGTALLVGAFLAPMPLALSFLLATMLGLMLSQSTRPLALQSKKLFPLINSALILAMVVLLFLTVKHAVSEVYASRGLNQNNAQAVERNLENAVRVSSRHDTYLRLLSEARRLSLRETIAKADPQNPQDLEQIRTAVERTLAPVRRAAELAPQNVAHFATLGNIYLEIAQFTSGAGLAAVEAFNRASALSPSDPAILTNLAVAKSLAATGEESAKEAQELLQKAQTIRPSFAFSALELARLHGRSKKVNEAVAAYRQTLELVPQDPAVRFEFGLFLMQNNKKDDARTELEEAVRLAPQFSNARWFLAQLLEEKGDTAGAIAQIEKVLELNPDNSQAKTRLEELLKKQVIK